MIKKTTIRIQGIEQIPLKPDPDRKWTLWKMKASDGNEYSFFGTYRQKYEALVGQETEISYEEVKNAKGYTQRRIIEEGSKKEGELLEEQKKADMMGILLEIRKDVKTLLSLRTGNSIKPAGDQPILQPDGAVTTPPEAPESPTGGVTPFKGGNDPTPPDNDPTFDDTGAGTSAKYNEEDQY